jgi:excisionase family DNA binding protein
MIPAPVTPVRGRLFKARAVAQYLGITEFKARQLIRTGELAAVRNGRGRLEGVYEQDCDAWIARRRTVATPAPVPPSVDERIARLLPAHRRFA